ncbi:16742_t:CDS:2 [Acaulospora morrowiae]|uniref:1-phosphatidylinositol-3-phosphate 5-kinase n=1 Tax=Acaulospora morrowiae TaxID=94023 RepID=A0A9N9AZ09_9GLOM|nr:16742_t:CDS:2 [Acaulospora morrowiae]
MTSFQKKSSLNTDVSTLTSFDFDRPFEQENENVLSKLFQRVKSSFVVSSPSSTTNANPIPINSNKINITEPCDISSIGSPTQSSEHTPSSSPPTLVPDKGVVPSVNLEPPTISLETAFSNTSILIESEIENHSDLAGNGNNSSVIASNNDINRNGSVINKDTSDTLSIRSVQTTSSVSNGYISKVIRRLRGEGVNKDYWMADDACKECYGCNIHFTIYRRKHHCRICGQIFCSKCASNIISGEKFNHEGSMRVCNWCSKIMKEYSEESDTDQGLTGKNDLSTYTPQVRQIHLTPENHIFPSNLSQDHLNPPPRAPSPDTLSLNDGIKKFFSSSLFMSRSRSNTITEENAAGSSLSTVPFRRVFGEEDKVIHDSVLDPEIAPYMRDEYDDGHYNSLVNPSNVLSYVPGISQQNGVNNESATPTPPISEYAGSDDEYEYSTRISQVKAIHKGQRTEDIRIHFARDKNAIPRKLSFTSGRPARISRRGSLLRQINTNLQSIDMSMAISPIEQRPSSPFNSRHTHSTSTPVKIELSPTSLQHMRQFLRQILMKEEIDLSEGWEDVIMRLMIEVSENLDPNVREGDEIDIRHYVKIKKIPGGTPQDSEYIHGVVCSKNLAHKKMPRILQNPRILILTFALEYHRAENHFMPIRPVIEQEEQHLRKLVNRISALAPHLVLVEKTVARKALQFLLEKNVAVALNVKPTVIEGVARCARADIIASIDKLALEPKLGKCGTFVVKTYVHQLIPNRRKTYLFFEKCPKELGCTIVLRGGNLETLKKIKTITDLMVFLVYNLKLETTLMDDQYAKVPMIQTLEESKATSSIGDDSDDIMKPYEYTILSVSPFIKFPPPYLLIKMKQTEYRLNELTLKRKGWSSGGFKDSEKQHSASSTAVSGLKSGILRTPEQVVAEGEYGDAILEHMLQTRAWQSYKYNDAVSPYAHQNITVLSIKICLATETACNNPEILLMEYYRESDLTLGQYLEEMCRSSSYICRTCDRPQYKHYYSFCHGNARITVDIQKNDIPQLNIEKKIFMSTHCKKCNISTPFGLMSEETWKYSFGKYLELSFYQTELKSLIENCTHDVYRDHELFFYHNKFTIRFKYEQIELLEIYPPPMTLHTKPEVQIRLKNHDLDTIRHKITKYWDSVADRIKNFNYDLVRSDKIEGCKQDLLEMSRRVVTEKKFMLQKLQQTYVNSVPEDTLALNSVMFVLQEKVVAWDKDFSDIVRRYFPRGLFLGDHDVINLGRPYQGSLLNDLPLINTEPDTEANSSRHDGEVLGPTILPKLGSSPTADLIMEQFKEFDFYHEGEIENLENDIEKVASQMTMFPFMDPMVFRRLSMKLMKESKRPKVSNRSISDSISATRMDKQEDSIIDFSHEPEVIPRLIPSTIRQRTLGSSSSREIPSFDPPSESERNRFSIGNRESRSSTLQSSTIRSDNLNLLFDKDAGSVYRSSYKKAHLRKNQNSSSEKSTSSRSNSRQIKPSTKNVNPDGYFLNAIRSHENKSRKLRKYKSVRPTILPSKPTISVFKNSTATAEESDEEFESADEEQDQNNEDDEVRIFSLNSTDAFDELLGNEEFFPLSGREPSNESYIYHSALTFLGQDLNEPTTPVSESPYSRPNVPGSSSLFTGRFLISNDTNESSTGATRKLVRSFASLWMGGRNLKPLDYPLNPTEHVFPDSSIIVREDELGSIIAFSLSSREYLDKLKNMQQSNQKNEAFMPDDERFGTRTSSWGILDAEENNEPDDELISHMKYEFSGGATQFSCKIFCAEQFDTLRRKCGCEDTYIQSLARCVKWDSTGGKSGSAFLKTRDDRLVMKQISRNEVDAFVKFAPRYFEYMAEALVKIPTCLTKIFGFYRVGYKNETTGKSMKIDIIVMENLFYERKVSKIFDLKGSKRNRHVQITGRENEVLLDENLLERKYSYQMLLSQGKPF